MHCFDGFMTFAENHSFTSEVHCTSTFRHEPGLTGAERTDGVDRFRSRYCYTGFGQLSTTGISRLFSVSLILHTSTNYG